MVALALFYNFDGWFINIECDLKSVSHAEAMRNFVEALTAAMHKKIPRSRVIWYDSLTTQGRLQWQDRLNGNNVPIQ